MTCVSAISADIPIDVRFFHRIKPNTALLHITVNSEIVPSKKIPIARRFCPSPCSYMPPSQSIPDDASKSMGNLERLLEITELPLGGSDKQGTTYKLSGSQVPSPCSSHWSPSFIPIIFNSVIWFQRYITPWIKIKRFAYYMLKKSLAPHKTKIIVTSTPHQLALIKMWQPPRLSIISTKSRAN